jgi:hypothetical protein
MRVSQFYRALDDALVQVQAHRGLNVIEIERTSDSRPAHTDSTRVKGTATTEKELPKQLRTDQMRQIVRGAQVLERQITAAQHMTPTRSIDEFLLPQ